MEPEVWEGEGEGKETKEMNIDKRRKEEKAEEEKEIRRRKRRKRRRRKRRRRKRRRRRKKRRSRRSRRAERLIMDFLTFGRNESGMNVNNRECSQNEK